MNQLEKIERGVKSHKTPIALGAFVTLVAIVLVLVFVVKGGKGSGEHSGSSHGSAPPAPPTDTYTLRVIPYVLGDDGSTLNEVTDSVSTRYTTNPAYIGIMANNQEQADILSELSLNPAAIDFAGGTELQRGIVSLAVGLIPAQPSVKTAWSDQDSKNVWLFRVAITDTHGDAARDMRNYVNVPLTMHPDSLSRHVRDAVGDIINDGETVSASFNVDGNPVVTFTRVNDGTSQRLDPVESQGALAGPDENGIMYSVYNPTSEDGVLLKVPEEMLNAHVTFGGTTQTDGGVTAITILYSDISSLPNNDGILTYTPSGCTQYGLPLDPDAFSINVRFYENPANAPVGKLQAFLTFRGTGSNFRLQTHLNIVNSENYEMAAVISYSEQLPIRYTDDGNDIENFVRLDTNAEVAPDVQTGARTVDVPANTTVVLVADALTESDWSATESASANQSPLSVTFGIKDIDGADTFTINVVPESAPLRFEGQTVASLATMIERARTSQVVTTGTDAEPSVTLDQLFNDFRELQTDGRKYALLGADDGDNVEITAVRVDAEGQISADLQFPAICGPTFTSAQLTVTDASADVPVGGGDVTPTDPLNVDDNMATIITFVDDANDNANRDADNAWVVKMLTATLRWRTGSTERDRLLAVDTVFSVPAPAPGEGAEENTGASGEQVDEDSGRHVLIPGFRLVLCEEGVAPETCVSPISPNLISDNNSISISDADDGTTTMTVSIRCDPNAYQLSTIWPVYIASMSLELEDVDGSSNRLDNLQTSARNNMVTVPYQTDGSEAVPPIIYDISLTPDQVKSMATSQSVTLTGIVNNYYGPGDQMGVSVTLGQLQSMSAVHVSSVQYNPTAEGMAVLSQILTLADDGVTVVEDSFLELVQGEQTLRFVQLDSGSVSYPYDPEVAFKIGQYCGLAHSAAYDSADDSADDSASTSPPMFVEAAKNITPDTWVITLYKGCWCMERMSAFTGRLSPDGSSIDPPGDDTFVCNIDMDTDVEVVSDSTIQSFREWFQTLKSIDVGQGALPPIPPFRHTMSMPFAKGGGNNGDPTSMNFYKLSDPSDTGWQLHYASPSLALTYDVLIVPSADEKTITATPTFVYADGLSSFFDSNPDQGPYVYPYRTYICDVTPVMSAPGPYSDSVAFDFHNTLLTTLDRVNPPMTGDSVASPLQDHSTISTLLDDGTATTNVKIGMSTEQHLDTNNVVTDLRPFVKYIFIAEDDALPVNVYHASDTVRALMEWQSFSAQYVAAYPGFPQFAIGVSQTAPIGKYSLHPSCSTFVRTIQYQDNCDVVESTRDSLQLVNVLVQDENGNATYQSVAAEDIETTGAVRFAQFTGPDYGGNRSLGNSGHCTSATVANIACQSLTVRDVTIDGSAVRTIDTSPQGDVPNSLQEYDVGRSMTAVEMVFSINTEVTISANPSATNVGGEFGARFKLTADPSQSFIAKMNAAQLDTLSKQILQLQEFPELNPIRVHCPVQQYEGTMWSGGSNGSPSWVLPPDAIGIELDATDDRTHVIDTNGNSVFTFTRFEDYPDDALPPYYISTGYVRHSTIRGAHISPLRNSPGNSSVQGGALIPGSTSNSLAAALGLTTAEGDAMFSSISMRPVRLESGFTYT